MFKKPNWHPLTPEQEAALKREARDDFRREVRATLGVLLTSPFILLPSLVVIWITFRLLTD